MAKPTSVVLYSTNAWLKWMICDRFSPTGHFVWCSEAFDPTPAAGATPWTSVPPSSSPREIYSALREACLREDKHDAKIISIRTGLKTLGTAWRANGHIDDDQLAEIIFHADNAGFKDLRPVLYVIPTALVVSRCVLVPPDKRAGIGLE